MKKLIALLLTLALMLCILAGCSNAKPAAETDGTNETTSAPQGSTPSAEAADGQPSATASGLPALTKDTIQVGFLYGSAIGDEGYTYCHDLGRQALEEMGIKTMYVESVPENAECEKYCRDLIEQGCNVIYGISFGQGEFIANVADEYPDVYFNHCTGYITKNNMSTYMGRMYEVQYLAGIAAGMRTETNKIGIVTTFPIPECVRQVNSFTLGVRSVNPEATVSVKWTSSWFDPATETASAIELLNSGCDVMAAYCDTMNPQIAAADAGKWALGCSSSGYDKIPDKYLTAPLFHYASFYTESVQSILDGTWTGTSHWDGMETGIVMLDNLTNCADGTEEAVEAAKQAILDGSLDMWSGELYDNQGNLKVEAGQTLSDADLQALDWLVEGVIGSVN